MLQKQLSISLRNVSRSNQCKSNTKSAFDKNLNANASSKNPKTTFTVFNQPPDFGNEFNQPGNIANNVKGSAIAEEKPNILIIGAIPPLPAAVTKAVPTIGPVQEKDTIAKAKCHEKRYLSFLLYQLVDLLYSPKN